MKLRDYQELALNNIIQDWHDYSAVLAKIPTGGGKTIVFLELLYRALRPGQRALILAHRKELIEQPIERIAQFWPDMAQHAGIVMADRRDVDAQVIVATVQTLAVPGRLEQILAHGAIDYVITDEAHHAIVDSYQSVYDRLRQFNPNLKHLGVTATPQRGDEAGLGTTFQKVSVDISIKDLVKMGHLVAPRWLAIQTSIDLSGISKHSGDFTQKDLANVYEVDNCFDLVVESHKKYADGRRGIAFVTSVDGAYRLAEKFNEAGISAAAADGKTRKDLRSQVLADFRAGKTQVLCNVALWTEGLDVPEIDLIHQVRPTQSDGLYVQMIGRGLRPVPGKDDCLILDYCPKDTRNIVMAGDVLGIQAKKQAYVKKDADRGDVVAGFTYDGHETKWLDGSPYELISRQLDYMGASPWMWTRYEDYLILGLGKASEGVDWTLVMTRVGENMRLIGVARADKDAPPKVKELCGKAYLIREGDFATLSEIAERIANERGNPTLIAKNRKWRKQAPTDDQIVYARRLGVYKTGMSRGTVAELITAKTALRYVQKAGLG